MSRVNSLAIIGWHDGTAGQIESWLRQSGEFHIECFINPSDSPLNIDPNSIDRDVSEFAYPTQNSFKNILLINKTDWTVEIKRLGVKNVLVTIDDPYQRYQQIIQAKAAGFKLVNVIHPSASIMADVKLGENIILYPLAYVGYRAEIGLGTFIDTGAQLDHHNVIRKCVTIDPGVIFAGNVTVGDFSQVHTGSVIKNRIRIGDQSIIGAGSVIIKDVPDCVTVVGVPGKIIKTHESLIS